MSGKIRLAVQLLGVFLVISLLIFGIYNFNMIIVVGAFLASFAVGRLFCGWLCPMGTWMEYVISRFSRKGQVPIWMKHKAFRAGFLAIFAIFIFWSFTVLPRPWNGFVIMFAMLVFGTSFGLLFAPKTWCAYACPWGTLMNMAGTRRFLSHTVSDCKKCYVCTASCFKPDMLHQSLEKLLGDGMLAGMSDCISCQKCVDRCPKKALKIA